MTQNLAYGTIIDAQSTPQTDNCVNEKFCLTSDPSCTQYGGFYQWDELMRYVNTAGSQGICPPGWHIPVESEWSTLVDFYGGSALAGKNLQDMTATPGFRALPGGVLYLNNEFSFKDFATLFWTSTPAPGNSLKIISHGMNDKDPSVSYYESSKANGFPVRCLKDSP